MKLRKVEYEFFHYEEPSIGALELDRQIRLQFDDAPTLYVSWTAERQHEPGAEPYSIAFGQASYFLDTAASVLDVSKSPLWDRHIGREVALVYSPPSARVACQVLEIRSGTDNCTYVYSLSLDRVGISDTPPASGSR